MSGHDRIAQAAVVEITYGSIPGFLVHHGFGPGALNPRQALAEWRTKGTLTSAQPPAPSPELIALARKLWDVLVAWINRFQGDPMQARLAALNASCSMEALGRGLELIARHCVSAGLPPMTVVVCFPEHGGLPDPRLPGHDEDIVSDIRNMRRFDWRSVANPFRASDEVVDPPR